MDRWKFVNEKWIPRPVSRGEGFIRRYCFSPHISCIRSDDMGIAASSYRSLPHWGRGTASAVDRVLSQTAYLRRSSSLFFIPLVPYPARSARHLPLEGKALSVVILFLHVSCIRFDDRGIAVFSFRCLPHAGKAVLSLCHPPQPALPLRRQSKRRREHPAPL